MSRNDELNEPSDTHPTAKQASVTVAPQRSSIIARSIRRVIKYVYGVSPYTARNRREKCADDIAARSAKGRHTQPIPIVPIHEISRKPQQDKLGHFIRRHHLTVPAPGRLVDIATGLNKTDREIGMTDRESGLDGRSYPDRVSVGARRSNNR